MEYLEHIFRMKSWDINKKRVFLRADLNNDTHIFDKEKNLKLQRLLPTLSYLKNNNARITLVTHIGRPSWHDPAYSTETLVHQLEKEGFTCIFTTVENLNKALDSSKNDIVLLENIRFYAEEYTESREFAQKITAQCDYFIQEAFGALLRKETSITTVADFFQHNHKSIGFLISEELTHLKHLKENVKKPFLIIMGGSKGPEKIKWLYTLLDTVTHIAFLPGLSEMPELDDFLHHAYKKSVTILLPQDYIIIKNQKVSIGPTTLKAWTPLIISMHTIFYNGLMGYLDRPETTIITRQLFALLSTIHADIILAGGDTTLAAQEWQLPTSTYMYLSTGGSATLAYISGHDLPGLTVI